MGLVVVAADAFLIEPHWLEVSHVRISSPKLTRPRRIVVLADIQVDSLGPYEREVIAKVAEAQPDVVLLAGDYIQAAPGEESALAELNAILHKRISRRTRVFSRCVATWKTPAGPKSFTALTSPRLRRRIRSTWAAGCG